VHWTGRSEILTVSCPFKKGGSRINICSAQFSCYPDLLEAAAEELVAGLESGAWASVDLTKVRPLPLL
jgi:hypothetical protein